MASNKIERAHQMYRDGRYGEALGFYTEAIAVAKTNPQKIALHSNRAACYLKLHDFKKAAEECTSVLELDQKHSGALMLRAQTLVTLKEYHSALFDVNRLLELNPDSEVYQNLQARLRTQLSLAPILESEEEFEEQGEEFEDSTEVILEGKNKKEAVGDIYTATSNIRRDQKVELGKDSVSAECASLERDSKFLSKQGTDQNNQPEKPNAEARVPKAPNGELSQQQSKGWQTIPKPKGHSTLDYARWDSVEDDSSEDDDDGDEESSPQYRFRVKTVGVRPVK